MKKALTSIVSLMLVLSLLFTTNISVFAAAEELYLSDLRIVYANDYDEAKQILAGTAFKEYSLLDENLNENTGEIGVWIAYKTTNNIEDAITDISVMQMNGGYHEGNYQEMIKQSYQEYAAMSQVYLTAVEYFAEAYDADSFLAKSAYRQLNFYTSVTDPELGIQIPSFDGEKLGDIFYEGIDAMELATMFMEGNSYALANIRSLLAMGVSYNEDGMTYLEKVAAAAASMNEDPQVFDEEDYDGLASVIAITISVFQDLFEELAAHEADLNYEDDELTETELYYFESYALAEMTRGVEYLNGQTLYDYCLNFKNDADNYYTLYPLVSALNDGQRAMTQLAHYYDVVRYSVPVYAEDVIEQELCALEEKYADNPFNIYTGVDRSLYTGTFALTTAAYRADAYTDSVSLMDSLFGPQAKMTGLSLGMQVVGLGLMGAAALHYHVADVPARTAALTQEISRLHTHYDTLLGNDTFTYYEYGLETQYTFNEYIDECFEKLAASNRQIYWDMKDLKLSEQSFIYKHDYLYDVLYENPTQTALSSQELDVLHNVVSESVDNAKEQLKTNGYDVTEAKINWVANNNVTLGVSLTTGLLYVAGGIMTLAGAISMGVTVYNYYHPEYADIPVALVDLIETDDGDRYIKYDAVLEAEAKQDGTYAPGDLNAFAAQRWNALYFTKSYEAGQPLLADEFVISNSNNTPKSNYAPVHRFGEVVSYDLNKYNFNDDHSIYLSVKQSKNQKAAVADVPEVVGSIFSNGLWLLVGGVGALVGIGGTLITTAALKKKRGKEAS